MVNTLLKYIGQSIKQSIKFVDRVDAPVKKLEIDSRVYKGDGSEKEDVSISDNFGNAVYIRQTQPEQGKEVKRMSSCGKQFQYVAKCRLIYYSFNDEFKEISLDERIQAFKNILTKLVFSGINSDSGLSIVAVSDNFERIFREETNQQYEGVNWPIILAIDFNLKYTDNNFCIENEC